MLPIASRQTEIRSMKKTLPMLVCALIALVVFGDAINHGPSVPEKAVVLTFDDSVASHYSVVRPLLKSLGFKATFFITKGFSFHTNKTDYMTWDQIRTLSRDGFEIGNHTRDHMGVQKESLPFLEEQVRSINERCLAHGIPRPVSFAYPGNAFDVEALPILQKLGMRFARRGGWPEAAYETGHGVAFDPLKDHPLLIPSAGDARPDWTMEDFKRVLGKGDAGRIPVLQFHGVPDREHPWVSTPPERFREYMLHLKKEGYLVLALRDLGAFVDPARIPDDPLRAMVERLQTDRSSPNPASS